MSNQNDSIISAEETLVGDLMEVCLQECRNLGQSWAETSEKDQQEIIWRVESGVKAAARSALEILAARDVPHVAAQVEQVVFKDGAKVVLTGFGKGFHDIADLAGKGVVTVVIADLSEFDLQGHGVKPDPDQADMLGEAA